VSFQYKYKSIAKIAAILFIVITVFGAVAFTSNLYSDRANEVSNERQSFDSKSELFHYPMEIRSGELKYDENGLPYQVMEDGRVIRNPISIADYVLFEDGIKSIEHIDNFVVDKNVLQMSTTQKAALQYYMECIKTIEYNGFAADVLVSDYPYIYNENLLDSSLGSSVAQYTWIRVLSYLYDVTGDLFYKDKLIRAMNAYHIPVEYGGLMYKFDDGGIWFEEIAVKNPSHNLSEHLASANVLYKISVKYGLDEFKELAKKAVITAEYRMNIFDLDNWSRDNMVWKLTENQVKVEFQPDIEGVDESRAFAVGSVETYREKEDEKYNLKADDSDAFQGFLRLAGMGWSDAESVNGEAGRWLIPAKYIYADYQNKFWENNIQSLMILSFPDSELPYEKESNFGLKLRCFAKYPGKLTVSIRDNSHSEDYRYNKSFSFEINDINEWNDIPIIIDKKYFSKHINANSHTRIIEILNDSASIFNKKNLKEAAQKFYEYYSNGYSDAPPINIRGINTLWGSAKNLNKDKSIKVNDLSDVFEKEDRYNVAKLIDGSLNDYAATQYNVNEAVVSLKMKDRAVLDSIKFVPYSKEIYFGAFKIKVFNNGNLVFQDNEITPKNLLDDNGFIYYRFSDIVDGDEVQVTFSDYKGQERFIINEIIIYGSYDRAVGRDLLKGLLNDAQDDLSKTIKIGSFTADYFEPGIPIDNGLKSILEQKVSACGINSNVARYLLAEAGIQSRFINLYNIPQVIGHSLIEVYLTNKWVYYDPTYAFFVAVPNNIMYKYDNSIENKFRNVRDQFILASLEDLSAHPEWIADYAMRYDFIPWTKAERIETLGNANLPLFPYGQYTSPNTVALADPKGPSGRDYPMKFKIYTDNQGASYGDINNSYSDLSKIEKPAGISYIGVGTRNVNWEFIFENKKVKTSKWKIEIYPQLVSGNDFLLILKLNNCLINGKKELEVKPAELNGKPIILEIERENENDFSVEVYHNSQGYMNVDAIRVQPTNE